jgi:NADH-quinone oxidoreductase subunit N
MAGVPPFIGFFSKLFILLLLLNNTFFILYFFFFVLIFLGLYFYIQNIKFLYSTNLQTSNTHFFIVERVTPIYLYFSITVLLLLALGMIYIDDICILFA